MNKLIKDIFHKMSVIERTNLFKYNAYIRAIDIIDNYGKEIRCSDDIKNHYVNNNRIGVKLLLKIDEIIDTGKLEVLEKYKNSISNIETLSSIMGIGNKKAKELIKQNIESLDDIKRSVRKGNIVLTHEQNLGIKYYSDLQQRIPRSQMNIFKKLFVKITKSIDSDLIIMICGSYRRELPNSGDIDILLSHKNPQDINYISEFINKLKDNNLFVDTIGIGITKYSGLVKLPNPKSIKQKYIRRLDIRYIPYNSLYTGILYYTGNREFNIQMRRKALSLNYSLSEYRLLNKTTNNIIPIKSEKEIFEKLEMTYVLPKNRNY
jgi:DNA polymerase beta